MNKTVYKSFPVLGLQPLLQPSPLYEAGKVCSHVGSRHPPRLLRAGPGPALFALLQQGSCPCICSDELPPPNGSLVLQTNNKAIMESCLGEMEVEPAMNWL